MSRFENRYVDREHRFSLGIEVATGRSVLSIPVDNGRVAYEEHYLIDAATWAACIADPDVARVLADRCRRREEDVRLLNPPGALRGTPA